MVTIHHFDGSGTLHQVPHVKTVRLALEILVNQLKSLDGADLRGAYLRWADLEGAFLEGAHLEDADLRGANLIDAKIEGAFLNGARLDGAATGNSDPLVFTRNMQRRMLRDMDPRRRAQSYGRVYTIPTIKR